MAGLWRETMSEAVSFEGQRQWGGPILAAVVLALLAGVPFVHSRFPEYLPSYLIQIPALLFAYGYAVRYDLLAYRWPERLALLIAFLVPLENTFALKVFRKAALDGHIALEIFRPSNMLLVGVAIYLAWSGRRVRLPELLKWSLIAGAAGWLVATMFAKDAFLSFGTGLFEFLAFWTALYVLLAIAPDRRFLAYAVTLFVASFALVALAQSAAIWLELPEETIFAVPVFADDFLTVKKHLPLMIKAGSNGYGNTDNFASLWVFVVPLLAGLAYCDRWKWAAWAVFAVLIYAGLLVYPRSAIGAVLVALAGLWVYRLHVFRPVGFGLIIAAVVILAIHANPEIGRYYVDGARSLIASLTSENASSRSVGTTPTKKAEQKSDNASRDDASGIARAEAWRRGVSISKENWKTGIGYGNYRTVDSEFTAPHNMVLLRSAEGGILSAISLLLLALYAPLRLTGALLRRDQDMFAVACLVAVSAFFLKALIFGATFAINGMIPWAFGVALLLAVPLATKEF
jgi:hypothetical protein